MKDLLKMLLGWILPTLILAGVVNTLVVLTVTDSAPPEKLGGVLLGLGELTASLGGWTLLRDKAPREGRDALRAAILVGIGVMGPGLALLASQALEREGGLSALLALSTLTVVPCSALLVAGVLRKRKKRLAKTQQTRRETMTSDPARLDQLKALKAAGLLTREEYEEKRRELLK